MYSSNDFLYIEEEHNMYYHIHIDSISAECLSEVIESQSHKVPYYHWDFKQKNKKNSVIIPNLSSKNALITMINIIGDSSFYNVYTTATVIKTMEIFCERFNIKK